VSFEFLAFVGWPSQFADPFRLAATTTTTTWTPPKTTTTTWEAPKTTQAKTYSSASSGQYSGQATFFFRAFALFRRFSGLF
jgi:hypothetical protein